MNKINWRLGNTSRRIDLTGRVFGRLTVLNLISAENGKLRWACKCTCGAKHEAVSGALMAGKVSSCGCWLRECRVARKLKHGQSVAGGTRTFHIWSCMRARCENKNSPAYKDYGARGITVCKRWAKFENFYADMGTCPPRLTLERKNNNKGYSLANCTWATRRQQANNRRARSVQNKNAARYLWKGKLLTLNDLSKLTGLKAKTIGARLKTGFTLVQALTAPLHTWRKNL